MRAPPAAPPLPSRSRSTRTPSVSRWRLAALGALVPCGWLLHDGLRYLESGDPAAGLELTSGALAAVALFALLGALLGRSALALGLALAATGGLALASELVERRYVLNEAWLPRVAFVLVAALALARAGQRLGLGTLRPALAAGALGCVLVTGLREPLSGSAWAVLIAAGGGLALGLVPRPLPRRLATAALVAWPLAQGLATARELAAAGRPDRPATAAAPRAGAPNLLLVVLDTVRADHLAPYGYGRVTTPRLDAFVRERAVRYEHARAAAAYTLPAHASLLTGLFPAEHGAHHPRVEGTALAFRDHRPAAGLRPDVPTLAETLAGHGYRTAAIVANNAYLHHVYGLDRGFEHYDDRDAGWTRDYLALPQFAGLSLRTGHVPYRNGEAITRAALRWLAGLDGRRPFFLLLNYMDAHSPYHPAERYARAFDEAQPADPLAPETELWPLLYDRTLLELDEHVGDLLDGMEAGGALDDTVVIVTSDHGEGFGEHDHWNHAWVLYEELVRVPLYVAPAASAGPRGPAVDPTPLTGVAVPHLALELLGIDAPASGGWPERYHGSVVAEWYAGRPTPGAFHLAEVRGRDVRSNLLAWIEGDLKFIAHTDGQLEAYDLAADPGEQAPLELDPARRERALELARGWWAAHPPLVPDDADGSAAPELDREHLDRLRGLGYLVE